MSGRLDLRRGVVVSADPLVVEVDGQERRAWADEVLLGEMRQRWRGFRAMMDHLV